MGRVRAFLVSFLWAAAPAFGQDAYPQKQVRVIVPFPAGGSADTLCRIVGERLGAAWNQPVIVDNRPGAGGNIGAEIVFRAEPDGYTLLCSPPGPLSINHNLYKSLPYDWSKFAPITVLALVPNVITAKLGLPANTAQELIAYGKANPGKLLYASQGNGSTSHLSAQMFATMAGIEMVHVPYRGSTGIVNQWLAGAWARGGATAWNGVESRCDAVALGSSISVAAPFVRRCLTGSTMAPFSHPAHRTGQADFPHPALGQNFTPSPTARRAQACSGVRAQSARKDARVDRSRPCDAWFCA